MTKTPEEIKKGLECCLGMDCGSCPYMTMEDECREVFSDALAYIQQLEEKVALYDEAVADALQLERERDAAVKELRGICHLCVHDYPGVLSLSGSDCDGCRHNAVDYDGDDKWQWRGAQEVGVE